MKAPEISMFYYTGTGNTWTVVRAAEDAFRSAGATATSRPIMDKNGRLAIPAVPADGIVGVAFPVYGLSEPAVIRSFVKGLPKGAGRKAFIIANAHTNTGKTRGRVARLLEKRGWEVAGTLETFTPSASIITEETEDEEKKEAMLAEARRAAEDFAEGILRDRAAVDEGTLSGREKAVSVLFGLVMPGAFLKKIAVGEDCTSCGRCEKSCPQGNIRLVDGRPRWGKDCAVCLRCLNGCPNMAINAMASAGRRRYMAPGFNPLSQEVHS